MRKLIEAPCTTSPHIDALGTRAVFDLMFEISPPARLRHARVQRLPSVMLLV